MNLRQVAENGPALLLLGLGPRLEDGRRHLAVEAEAADGVACRAPPVPLGATLNRNEMLGDLEGEEV